MKNLYDIKNITYKSYDMILSTLKISALFRDFWLEKIWNFSLIFFDSFFFEVSFDFLLNFFGLFSRSAGSFILFCIIPAKKL